MTKAVWMFPGPSSHVAGALGQLVDPGSQQMSLLKTIDAVSEEYGWGPVSPLLLGPADENEPQTPGHLWLGFFATSLVLSELLIDAGVPGDVLVGHSGGEVTAMVVAGSMTVEDAARVLCERTLAVDGSGLPASAMVALNAPARRVARLIEAVGDSSLALAVDNGPDQVVVSGLLPALDKLEDAAAALEIKAHRLKIPSGYHNPILGGAARRLTDRIRSFPVGAPRREVYSPQLQRVMATADDARDLLAGTLVLPVHYRRSLRVLYDDGARLFVECGARQVLTELVPQALPAAADAVALLTGRAQARAVPQLIRTLAAEHAEGWPGESLLTVEAAGPSAEVAPVAVAVPVPAPAEPAEPAAPVAPGVPEPVRTHDPAPAPVPAPAPDGLPAEAALRDRVRQAYAEALRFPAEMVEDDTELEGELGISSLQRTNVFVQLLNTFDLPNPDESVQIFKYRTVAEMAGLLRELAASR
ncbi:acyltransferase domain-containing protein [Streptomyces sp. NPDC091371]|uniref:acyltransferase domain-containing protein n=1 Tax=Streptomyces sp. NPDC091371 TaxID=3155303 RepID=UPI003414EBCE